MTTILVHVDGENITRYQKLYMLTGNPENNYINDFRFVMDIICNIIEGRGFIYKTNILELFG